MPVCCARRRSSRQLQKQVQQRLEETATPRAHGSETLPQHSDMDCRGTIASHLLKLRLGMSANWHTDDTVFTEWQKRQQNGNFRFTIADREVVQGNARQLLRADHMHNVAQQAYFLRVNVSQSAGLKQRLENLAMVSRFIHKYVPEPPRAGAGAGAGAASS